MKAMIQVATKKVRRRRLAAVSRRTFMKCAGTFVATPLLVGSAGCLANGRNGGHEVETVLLGTTGGPSWWPQSERMGASSALVVRDTASNEESVYLVDVGYGSMQRLSEAFNDGRFVETPGGMVQQGYPQYMSYVKALFITHLHPDHITDLPALLLYGQGVGLPSIQEGLGKERLQIVGPGSRGKQEDVFPPGRPYTAVTVNPENPTPGTKDMVDSLFAAYAQTMNNFTRESGWGDFTKLADVYEVDAPPLPREDYPEDPATGKPLNSAPWPDMNPILVYEDILVSVRAVLVNHGPVYPAFGYRFDTAQGAVVFSGDTGYPCENLTRLASGADVLVHEAIDLDFVDALFPEPLSEGHKAMKDHLASTHTSIEDAGRQAAASGVGTLVLNHLVPGNTLDAKLLQAQKHFSGKVYVGQDLLRIPLRAETVGEFTA